MVVIAIGKSAKNFDKLTEGKLLSRRILIERQAVS